MPKSIKNLMHLGIDIWSDFNGFWKKNEAKLAPESIKNRCHLRKTIFWKIVLSLQRGLDFLGSGDPSGEQKSIKNRSKQEFNLGRHLGIDLWAILVDFGKQVGVKSIQKGIEKVMKKRRAPRWEKSRSKSEWITRGFPEPRGGVGGGVSDSRNKSWATTKLEI